LIQRSERVLPLLTAVLSALVVDDYVQVQALAGGAFAHERIHCEFASDGAQAHTTLEGTRYQVVVTDLRMPKVNGHALCRTVLALPHRPWLVAITAVGEPRLRDLEARGVAAVFEKPLDFATFVGRAVCPVIRLCLVPSTPPERGRIASRIDGVGIRPPRPVVSHTQTSRRKSSATRDRRRPRRIRTA
jgi:CheY-like chemotaxis protein